MATPHPPGTFYDVATDGALQIDLQLLDSGSFRLLRQFGYVDNAHPTDPFIVPDDTTTFETDLASIPRFFTWLVPIHGDHFPAVLLHDGLVVGRGAPPTHLGPAVTREQADRIFRDAMKASGTPLVRRWLIWTAVVLATAWLDLDPRWWWRSLWILTLGAISILGLLALLDLVDVIGFVPWMGALPWWRELLQGGLVAILVPLLLSILWLRLWIAAAIGGIAYAFLILVTLAIAILYLGYLGLEWIGAQLDH